MSNKLAQKIIDDILDKGLADSTFRDKYPEAYEELLFYRVDMVTKVTKIITKENKKVNKS